MYNILFIIAAILVIAGIVRSCGVACSAASS